MDRKKIFAKHTSNKGLVSEICKQLKFNSKKINLIKNWAMDQNRYRYKKTTVLIVRELQIETTMRYLTILVMKATTDKTSKTNACKDVEQREP